MILLGIWTDKGWTAVNGTVERADGGTEKEVVGVVCGDVFAATAMALTDATVMRVRGVRMYTNDEKLLQFLTPPIYVKPTSEVEVKGWGKVGVGGDGNQWTILYRLFACGSWRIQKVTKLPGTESIYHECCKTERYQAATRQGVPGCFRRVHEGVWTNA